MEIWECLCLDLGVLPDFGYANYFPSLSAVSETWNNKVLEIMLKAFSFYRSENRGPESCCSRRVGPSLQAAPASPCSWREASGGKRPAAERGCGDRTERVVPLVPPVLSFFASQGSISRLAEQGRVQGRLGGKGGLQGRGRHQ